MWLKLIKTGEAVEDINTNIAIAYLTLKSYRDKKVTFNSLSEKTKRTKLSRIYKALYKNRLLSEEVSIFVLI